MAHTGKLARILRNELYRQYSCLRLTLNKFSSKEPEYQVLGRYVADGDWVIDVGANVGHYTKRFSDLVGPRGRVVALEPVPDTFSILAANAMLFRHANTTPMCVAASDSSSIRYIDIPKDGKGRWNFYRSALAPQGIPVLAIPLDSIPIHGKLSVVKIDVEGHELAALAGARETILKHRPVIIVEANFSIEALLGALRPATYSSSRLDNSPNWLLVPA